MRRCNGARARSELFDRELENDFSFLFTFSFSSFSLFFLFFPRAYGRPRLQGRGTGGNGLRQARRLPRRTPVRLRGRAGRRGEDGLVGRRR